MKLAQRVAVITGAAQGIGAACTRLFAEQGAKVVIADINETSGSALADEIVRGGGTALFLRTDVAARSDCTALIEHAIARFESTSWSITLALFTALTFSTLPRKISTAY